MKAAKPAKPKISNKALSEAVFRQVCSDPRASSAARVTAAERLHEIECGKIGVARPVNCDDVSTLSDEALGALLQTVVREIDARMPGSLEAMLRDWAEEHERDTGASISAIPRYTRGDALPPSAVEHVPGPRWPPSGDESVSAPIPMARPAPRRVSGAPNRFLGLRPLNHHRKL